MNAAVRVSIARPGMVVALWALLAALCVQPMLNLSGALKAGGFDNPRGDDAAGQAISGRAFREAPESLQIVLHATTGSVTDAVPVVERVANDTPHVASVGDYHANPGWLSKNRRTTFVQLDFTADNTTIQGVIPGLRARLAGALHGRAVDAHVTGAQALDYDLSVQSERDASTAEMIAFPLLFVVLLLVFRSVVAMLLPAAIAGVALVVAMAAGYLLTLVTDVSSLFSNAVSIIGLAVAVDYSLFIIKRYRDELADGGDHRSALRTAMATAGRSVLFSGLAVVVALLALFIPGIMVFTSIALAGIVVTLVALAMSMTLLPAVLTLLGHRINWASIGRRRAKRRRSRVPDALTALYRRPVPLLLVLLALFAAAAWPVSTIRLQAPVVSASILPSTTDSREGIARLRSDLAFRDLFPVQVLVTTRLGGMPQQVLAGVRAVDRVVGARPRIESVRDVVRIGLPTPLLDAATGDHAETLPPQARAAFGQLWGEDRGHDVAKVVVVPADDPDSDRAHDLVRALRAELPPLLPPGVSVLVTGATAHGVDFDEVLVDTLPAILAAVALITVALLARAFRSWLLPLLALFLNAIVVAASLGLLTEISEHLLGQRIDSTTPALVFAVMFGLSMDYMVIMISRMRERFHVHGDHHAAIGEGMRSTAGLVNGAALIMVAVFVSFLSAKISVVQQLGLGLAIAVVLDAVLIRLLVMPACLYLLGPRCWGHTAEHDPGEPAAPSTPDTVLAG